jgi:hypothetical protein
MDVVLLQHPQVNVETRTALHRLEWSKSRMDKAIAVTNHPMHLRANCFMDGDTEVGFLDLSDRGLSVGCGGPACVSVGCRGLTWVIGRIQRSEIAGVGWIRRNDLGFSVGCDDPTWVSVGYRGLI